MRVFLEPNRHYFSIDFIFRREAALTRTAKSLCAGPTTSSNLDSHMGRRKSCCVPAVLRTTHPCARNNFFKHIHNFLWALPSWKSLAPVHKMIGKITRKNIINICSSYRPCPVRSNIEKSTSGKVYKPIGDRLAHPRYFPAVPWASGRPSCPVSGPTLSRTHSSPQQGAPSVVDIRCLTVVSRGIREPSEEEAGTQQSLRAVPGYDVPQACSSAS